MFDATVDARRRFFELFEREFNAANEYLDRRDAEMLRGWRTYLPEPPRNKSSG